MYSLIKGYISSSNVEEEQESAFSEEAVESRQLKEKRAAFRSTRSKSESSAVAGGSVPRYLSWENVSFLGHEIRKTVSRGFHWIASPSLEHEMSLKVKRRPPDGTKEYLVDTNDTLAKIALSFDTTPSELTRINKLSSRMLFPGQTLFVPDKGLETSTSAESEPSSSLPVTKPPQPLVTKENGNTHNGDHETVKLTKDVSWEEEEEEITEHYLKIYAKYITDGQGIANGVLLITPHSVMFKPNVSDPLVMDRGQDTYSIATLMTSVTSAAMYTDIAAMAIHDPLKPGRFYLDAATAETLSRQNSISDTETTSPSICKSCGKVCTNLKDITEDINAEHLKSESQLADVTHRCVCNAVNSSPAVDEEEIRNIVHEVLNSVINQIEECEDSHMRAKTVKPEGTPMLVKDSLVSRDMHSVSPVSEDSGIGCSLSHVDDGKAEDSDLANHADHKDNNQLNDVTTQVSSGSARLEHVESQSTQTQEHAEESEMNSLRGLDHPRSSSLFAAFSSNVKYWLGQGTYGKYERHGSESDEDVSHVVPKPATPLHHQPLYLCLRISKKHWCRHHSAAGIILQQGEELHDRDQKRREYWFAIPPSRTEQVYRFFQQWCPNIHNATDEDESGDDEITSLKCCTADEEGLNMVETFYSSSPPVHSHPKVSRALSDSEVLKVKKGFRGFTTKPGKAAKVATSPKPSPDFIEDVLPDMDSKSELLSEERLTTLNSSLPSRTIGHCWVLVYSTFEHGFSLNTLYRKMEYYDTPVLLVVMDDAHQIFGSLCSCPLKISEGFYGTGESFLYKFDKNDVKTFGWSGENNFFIKGSKDSLAIGSGGGNFGLWLDEDLYHGRSHPCSTYNNEQLSSREDFLCSGLEAWTFV
ncbi:hypothetical protein ACROYT_G032443 [Oculina patagonica]